MNMALKRAKRPATVIKSRITHSDGSVTIYTKNIDKYGVIKRNSVTVVNHTTKAR